MAALYDVGRLVLSPIVTRPAAQQQLRVSWGGGVGWWGRPCHYVVTPTRIEVELRLSWDQPNNLTPPPPPHPTSETFSMALQ